MGSHRKGNGPKSVGSNDSCNSGNSSSICPKTGRSHKKRGLPQHGWQGDEVGDGECTRTSMQHPAEGGGGGPEREMWETASMRALVVEGSKACRMG